MEAFVIAHEAALLSALFYGTIIVVVVWEFIQPRRSLTRPCWIRWLGNIGLGASNTLLVSVVGISGAIIAQQQDLGVLNNAHLPYPVTIVVALILLDLGQYIAHRIFHVIPALWRLHLVHHSDLDCDFTTSFRHHPVEYLLNVGIHVALVAAIGPPILAYLLYYLVISASDFVRHGNIRVPVAIDRYLRFVLVTPDFHRLHHSAVMTETNSNYSNLFPWWDHLFRTYRDRPEAGYEQMTIGLGYFRETKELWPHWILTQPFRASRHSQEQERSTTTSPSLNELDADQHPAPL